MNTSIVDLPAALAKVVGAEHVLTEPPDLAPFVEDWRGRYRGEVCAVVLPASTEELSAVVRLCAQAGVKVLPQGGHTGLVGGATPVGARRDDGSAPVIVAMRRMNRIREIDPVGNTLVAEAGCVLETLQQAAAEQGRLYGVTFGAQGSCQIGGNVSTNAGGTGVLKYGNTREQVLGLEVVLPDGRIWNGLRTLRKDNAGYNLKHLFIGGEGTLGIVTAVAVRLHPRPAVLANAWLTLDSVENALACLAHLQSIAGDRIAAYELLNRAQLRAVQDHFPDVRLPADPDAPYAVLLELSDTYARADLNGLMEDALGQLSERGLLRDAAIAASEAQRAAFWHIRHGISEANRKAGMGLSTDVAVPVKSLAVFIENASRAVLARWPQLEIVLVAHMGDGNVHFIPRYSFEAWSQVEDQPVVADAVRAAVHDEAVALGGTFSAEHGVGYVLVDELSRLRAPLELEMMRRVRVAFDPEGLMNPGKLIDG
ncbi:FAD-binding oxidoreductase [Hydrogenophaga palleronii]|uniref:FAD-binding oxidoreductase n=1 Tax=Hydrogenophaga palleronii TaxID=65655 RepID=UPI0008269FAA|nr:FAD-binding oxidoreductase [Hydrogenophaga palleronii]